MIRDITPMVTPALAVWPGDTPMSREVLMDIARGDSVTLSTLRATVHLGAHADAPSHYGAGGGTIEGQSLDHYLGVCRVVSVEAARGTRVRPEDLPRGVNIEERRVLFRTGTFPDPGAWNADFAGLSPDLIEMLANRGVITVGVDTPSVDLMESKDLPAHGACLRRGVAILEGLDLSAVGDGVYELIALPLRLQGFDASPVRAVLRDL